MDKPESFSHVEQINHEGNRLLAPSNLLRLQDPFKRLVRSFFASRMSIGLRKVCTTGAMAVPDA